MKAYISVGYIVVEIYTDVKLIPYSVFLIFSPLLIDPKPVWVYFGHKKTWPIENYYAEVQKKLIGTGSISIIGKKIRKKESTLHQWNISELDVLKIGWFV